MLQGFNWNLITPAPAAALLGNLLAAFLGGLILAYMYRRVFRGPHYSLSFVHSLVILPMVTTLVIMVIGNNLARAFGLVGAMSIIRFRTAVKDTQDIVFIFMSLAIGMAAGVGLRFTALVSALLIGLVLVLLNHTQYGRMSKTDLLLQFSCDLSAADAPYLEVLNSFCRELKLIHTQSQAGEQVYEISYHVRLKKGKSTTELIKALRQIEHINEVRLFYDED